MAIISFPNDTMADEIPVFMAFYWNRYSRYNSDRTYNAVKGGQNGASNAIVVPYPKRFNVSNDVPYTNAGTLSTGSAMQNLKMQYDNLTFEANMAISYFLKGGSSFTFDNMETVLAPGARRKYDVGIELIAKTTNQAVQIKTITDTFQQNAFSSWDGGNRLIWEHPPLWVMQTVNNSSAGGDVSGWSPSSLPSVLIHVDINRNPILDTPVNLSNNHPLAVTMNLSFVELEPAVNNKIAGTLTNRATTFR
jgi:hypothetical protein